MCFGCCDEPNSSSHWQSTQPNYDGGFVQDRPIYDNTMGQSIHTQPSYGYGGGLDTTISSQPSFGGGFVQDRPIYDNTMSQPNYGYGGGLDTTINSQPSYGGGYGGGGLDTTINSQPSYGGGYGGGMQEQIHSQPSRY